MNTATQFYRTILKNYDNEFAHKKNLQELNNSNYSVMSEKDGVTFFLYLGDTLQIKNALFSYSNKNYLSSLMEITCRVIKGLPIKEVREHGSIRVENFLNPYLKTTVKGVSLPTNYSVDFIWLNDFLISITDTIINKSKIKNKINFYYPKATKNWLEKEDNEKKLIIDKYVQKIKSSTNIQPKDVKIITVGNDHVYIEILNIFNPIDKSIYCMELEKIVRNDYDFLIVYMQRAQDINSIRRKLDLK